MTSEDDTSGLAVAGVPKVNIEAGRPQSREL